MSRSKSVLTQLKELGYSGDDITFAIRKAKDPNDINQCMDIILQKELQPGSTNPISCVHNENDLTPIILPKGWNQCTTNDGQIYYVDHNTKQTHWSIPEEAYWSECISKDGKIYYKNHKSKTTHWKLPTY